eukprot:3918024-Pyramimonas_sp.AAC.1
MCIRDSPKLEHGEGPVQPVPRLAHVGGPIDAVIRVELPEFTSVARTRQCIRCWGTECPV